MVDANIQPTEEALAVFNDIKMNKKYRFVLYKIVDLGATKEVPH